MASNKLYTKSYFKMRLIESGIRVSDVWFGKNKDIQVSYDNDDTRRWTLLIDGGGLNVVCTCVYHRELAKDCTFSFIQPNNVGLSLKTQSMETVIDYLTTLGVKSNKKE